MHQLNIAEVCYDDSKGNYDKAWASALNVRKKIAIFERQVICFFYGDAIIRVGWVVGMPKYLQGQHGAVKKYSDKILSFEMNLK